MDQYPTTQAFQLGPVFSHSSVKEAIDYEPLIAAASRCGLTSHTGGICSASACPVTRGIGTEKIPGLATATPGPVGTITGKNDRAILTIAPGPTRLAP